MKVLLELNENQAKIVEVALDIYLRLHLCQFDMIRYIHFDKNFDGTIFEYAADLMKYSIHPELAKNASYGIYSKEVSDNARIAWDIHQVLRYKVSWKKNPNGGITVNFDPPMVSSKEPLPKVTIED